MHETRREERTAIQEVIFRAESLHADMSFNIMPTENDVSVTSYVTGYCCRSLAKSNRCDSCKDITIASVEYLAPEAEPNVPINAINFLTVSIVVDSPSQQKKCLMLASLLGGICRTLC